MVRCLAVNLLSKTYFAWKWNITTRFHLRPFDENEDEKMKRWEFQMKRCLSIRFEDEAIRISEKQCISRLQVFHSWNKRTLYWSANTYLYGDQRKIQISRCFDILVVLASSPNRHITKFEMLRNERTERGNQKEDMEWKKPEVQEKRRNGQKQRNRRIRRRSSQVCRSSTRGCPQRRQDRLLRQRATARLRSGHWPSRRFQESRSGAGTTCRNTLPEEIMSESIFAWQSDHITSP